MYQVSCVSLIHANTEFAKIELLIQADGCREPAWSRFGDLFEWEQDNWWKLNKSSNISSHLLLAHLISLKREEKQAVTVQTVNFYTNWINIKETRLDSCLLFILLTRGAPDVGVRTCAYIPLDLWRNQPWPSPSSNRHLEHLDGKVVTKQWWQHSDNSAVIIITSRCFPHLTSSTKTRVQHLCLGLFHIYPG